MSTEERFFAIKRNNRITLTDKEGKERVLDVKKKKDADTYEVFENKKKVFEAYSIVPIIDGWYEIEDIRPADNDSYSLVGIGLGKKIYDFIDEDLIKAGGKGLIPSIGAMSDEAIVFWIKRLRIKFPEITKTMSDEELDKILRFKKNDPDDLREPHIRMEQQRQKFIELFG